MTELKDAEVREFWEWCGVKPHIKIINIKYHAGMALDGSGDMVEEYPTIDLNNLFKYAVPTIPRFFRVSLGLLNRWYCEIHQYNETGDRPEVMNDYHTAIRCIRGMGETPALALFRAIQEVIR